MWGKKDNMVDGVPIGQVLWGGPKGEGLVTTVARLVASSEKLNESVNRLADKVMGSDGLQVDVANLKNEVRNTKERVDSIFAFGKWALLAFWGLLVPGIAYVVAAAIRLSLMPTPPLH